MRFVAVFFSMFSMGSAWGLPPVRVAIAGLTHGHVEGFLSDVIRRPEFKLAGISETHAGAIDRYFTKYKLEREILFPDAETLVKKSQPSVIAIFGPTTDHLAIVRTAIANKIPVMMEKPLAAGLPDAREIERLSRESGIPVVVNYETTWYPNTHFLFSSGGIGRLGTLRKVVVRTGHRGPLEIGVHGEFLAWLTDPTRGGGALLDFGCYGVQLLAKLFEGKAPIAVTAITQKLKSHPAYSRVEDEATILVEYPGAQGIVQASWNWPSNRKDWEVHGEEGSLASQSRDGFTMTEPNGHTWSGSAPAISGADSDPLVYLQHLVGQPVTPSSVTKELSSASLNLEVSRILEAAAQSAREARRIEF